MTLRTFSISSTKLIYAFEKALDCRHEDDGEVMMSYEKGCKHSFALTALIEDTAECISRVQQILQRNPDNSAIIELGDKLKAAIIKLRQKAGF